MEIRAPNNQHCHTTLESFSSFLIMTQATHSNRERNEIIWLTATSIVSLQAMSSRSTKETKGESPDTG